MSGQGGGRQVNRIMLAEAGSGNERSLQRSRVFYRRETECISSHRREATSAVVKGGNGSHNQMFIKYLTILLAVLLVCGGLVAQKPGSRTPLPKNKGSEERVKELTAGRQMPTTAKPNTIQDFPIAVKR
jgi:hypothetical protein